MMRIDFSQISEGMVLAEPLFYGPDNKLLLNSGTIINECHIDAIKKFNIKTIAISERYTLLIDPKTAVYKDISLKLETEILRLAPEKDEANKTDFMITISKRARIIADKILKNSIVVDFLMRIKLVDDIFLLRHSIETCALSLLVAGALGANDVELFNIGAAAILHDIGLCEMPHLIYKSDKKPHEEKLWNEHPVYGHYLINESGLTRDISKYVLHHHELWNGDGIPHKLSGENIPFGSRIIQVCDNYNKLLRQDNFPEYQAIEYLYGAGGHYFDSKIVQAFFNNLAVHPLGSLVRLTTGEVGVVTNVRKNLGPRPIVRVYYNRVNRPLTVPKDVDLGQELTIFIKQVL